jgi:hypothetical protein
MTFAAGIDRAVGESLGALSRREEAAPERLALSPFVLTFPTFRSPIPPRRPVVVEGNEGGGEMAEHQAKKPKETYVYVKDEKGVVYVCRAGDLKRPDELTEEEKASCMMPPGDA